MQETLLTNGRVYASSEGGPEEAILLLGGRVAAVGTDAAVRARASRDALRIDLDGAAVTAGFTDAHVHLTTWALARGHAELGSAASVAEVAARIAEAGAGPGGWIRGHGWSRNRLERAPTYRDLDAVRPDLPVFLDSQDIHAAWLNGEALRRCGIDRSSADPEGGRIERDPDTGEPTGLLLENARALALARLPAPTEPEITDALLAAQSEAHRYGITAVHSVEVSGLEDFSRMAERDALRLRVLQHIQLDRLDAALALGLRSGFGGAWVRIGGVKMFLDGSLGSRTAWMRDPYTDPADACGIRTLEPDAFRAAVERATAGGLAAAVHAIGDAAVALALEVLHDVPPPAALPHRIEHVQLCPPDLWARAGGSGIVASMQPAHLLTDVPAAERHWGHPRCRGAYAFGALRGAGMTLAFGSDVPVETLDPRPGLFAARRRRTWSDYASRGGEMEGDDWYPEHRLDAAAAVAGYTEGPAHAAGWSGFRGRLAPGFDADLAVWSEDPFTLDARRLHEMECVATVVAGEIVHRAGL